MEDVDYHCIVEDINQIKSDIKEIKNSLSLIKDDIFHDHLIVIEQLKEKLEKLSPVIEAKEVDIFDYDF